MKKNSAEVRAGKRRDARVIISSFLSYLSRNGFRVVDRNNRNPRDMGEFVDGFVHRS